MEECGKREGKSPWEGGNAERSTVSFSSTKSVTGRNQTTKGVPKTISPLGVYLLQGIRKNNAIVLFKKKEMEMHSHGVGNSIAAK